LPEAAAFAFPESLRFQSILFSHLSGISVKYQCVQTLKFVPDWSIKGYPEALQLIVKKCKRRIPLGGTQLTDGPYVREGHDFSRAENVLGDGGFSR
jgi:hypothetical protein